MKTKASIASQRGFTMVELMITVVILGILAAVAIPSFTGFLRESKTSESSINVRAIATGAVSWFNDTHNDENGKQLIAHFPNTLSPHKVPNGSSPVFMPSEDPCHNGTPLYKVDTSRGEVQPWKTLKFSIRRDHYYQYTYDTDGVSTNAYFAIRAMADLPCNKTYRSLIQCGTVNPKTGEVERSEMLDLRGKVDASGVCKPAAPPTPPPPLPT